MAMMPHESEASMVVSDEALVRAIQDAANFGPVQHQH
jgi:hypothetical protein